MKNKYKSLFKNVGLFTLGSFGSKIVSFLLVPLYTSILSTADYGMVDVIYSTVSMITPIFLLSIQDATLRFGMDPKYNKEDVLSTTFNIILKGSAVLFVCLILIKLLNLFNISIEYFIFLFFIFAVGAINNCASIYLKAKNKVAVIAISGVLCTIITCVGNILFLVPFRLGIMGYMLSNALGLLVQLVYQIIAGKIHNDLKIRNYTDLSIPMIKYSSPLIANSIAWWVNNASDRYILLWLCDVSVNGVYSISYKIPTILTTFQSIFYNAWSISAISEFDKDDNDSFIGNNYTLYSLISILVCSMIILINIPLAKILYSGDFFDAWRCVPFLMVGTVFNGISQFEGSLFAAVKNTKRVSTTTVIGAVVNTVINLLLIPIWGAVGAALATMVGYCVMWALRTIFMQDFLKMNVDWERHILSIVLVIIQATLATFNIFHFIQIAIFIIIIILHWNMFISIVKMTLKKVKNR